MQLCYIWVASGEYPLVTKSAFKGQETQKERIPTIKSRIREIVEPLTRVLYQKKGKKKIKRKKNEKEAKEEGKDRR